MADGDGLANGDAGNGSEGKPLSFDVDSIGAIFDGATVATPAFESSGKDDGGNDSGAGGVPPKRGRGRPKGSGTKKAREAHAIDLSGLEKLLLSLHAGLAAITHTPELQLDESEAKSMSTAAARVARHYPILDKIGDKAIDHANLVVVLSSVYGSRAIAWGMRRTAEKAKPTEAEIITPNFGQHGPAG